MKTSYWRKFIEELIEKKYKTKEEYAEGLMAEIKRMLEIIESADFAIEELSTRNIRLEEENKELKEELEKLEEEIAMIEEDNKISKERIILKDNRIRTLIEERQENEEFEMKMHNETIGRDERKDGNIISSIKVKWLNWYGKYETAVKYPNGVIRVIEWYETEEECRAGHEKYLNMPQEEFDKLEFID